MPDFKMTKADVGLILAKAKKIEAQVNVVKEAFTSFDAITTLLGAGWEGEAAEQFLQIHQAIKTDLLEEWEKAGRELCGQLEKCGLEYSRAEDEVMTQVRALTQN
jgi:uncharacterized protein YukE